MIDKQQSYNIDGVYLGVSLASQYYSKKRLRSYLSWASVNCNKFAFLIGDEIYAYTYAALNSVSIQDAEIVANKLGDQSEISLLGLPTSNLPIKIFRWKDLKTKEYEAILKSTINEYTNNIAFANRVRSQVWENLGNRLWAAGACKKAGCNHEACTLLDQYVLHEIPGLTVISEYLGYPTEIYPGPDLSILSDLYRGDFDFFTELLPTSSKRMFMRIVIDEEVD